MKLINRVFLIAGLTAMVAACAPMPPGKAKNFGVTLDPKPQQGNVKVISKAQGWNKNNKKDGYVGYAVGESGWTFFVVKQEAAGDSCPVQGGSGSAEWVITRLQVSATGDSATEKGSDFGSPQPQWLQEAFPMVDLSDGDLFEADKENGLTFLPIFNANGQEGYRFVYYQLSLTRCSDGTTLTVDPGWGNGGRK